MAIMTAASRARAAAREIRLTRPYQAALPDYFCTAENFDAIVRFCQEAFGERPVTRMMRARWEDGGEDDMRLHCFTCPERADMFAQHFDAVRYDQPAGHGREPVWTLPGRWSIRLQYGPLAVPRWVRENP